MPVRQAGNMKTRMTPYGYFIGLLAISVLLHFVPPGMVVYPHSMVGIIPVIAGGKRILAIFHSKRVNFSGLIHNQLI
jgi:hypothetical protein